jgi:hypothetical protein
LPDEYEERKEDDDELEKETGCGLLLPPTHCH